MFNSKLMISTFVLGVLFSACSDKGDGSSQNTDTLSDISSVTDTYTFTSTNTQTNTQTQPEDNQAPSAVIESLPVANESRTMSFDASNSEDIDGDVTQYFWIIDGVQYSTQNVEHEFTSPGEKEISLMVIDDSGEASLVSMQTIVIENQKPTAHIDVVVDGLSVEISALNIIDLDGDDVSVSWNVNGTTSTLDSTSYISEAPQTVEIQLYLNDGFDLVQINKSIETTNLPIIDDDNDGVANANDDCPLTVGEVVSNGCSQTQLDAINNALDDDNDGVNNEIDDCPFTTTAVVLNGCSQNQLDQIDGLNDDDNDSVLNKDDVCPNQYALTIDGCPLDGPIDPVVGGEPDIDAGAISWQTLCADCHEPGVAINLFTLPLDNRTDEQLHGTIDLSMPFGTVGNITYTPDQCGAQCAINIVAYLRAGKPDSAGHDEAPISFEGCMEPEGAPASKAIRLLTRHEFENSINDIFNTNLSLTQNFPPESVVHGFSNNADTAFVTARHLDLYYGAAAKVRDHIKDNFDNTIRNELGCNSNVACVETFVRNYGRKVFRRTLTEEEVTTYLAFFTEGVEDFNHSEKFKEVVVQGLPALLMSPNFLYRTEIGVADGSVNKLTQLEIASLISYTFTGSTPDETLLALAESGGLNSKAVYKQQAQRLLATDKGQNQMAHFAAQWLDAGEEMVGSKNNEIYPGYNADTVQSMVGELKAFFKEVAFESTGEFEELYNPGFAMLDQTLSEFYGLGSINQDGFYQVPNDQRGGLLSLGAVLAANASTEETSPVKRGIFVREQLMCDHLPPIPRDVNIQAPDLDPSKPMRERFEIHSNDASCWSCHRLIDDMGYAMEIFDAAGKFREKEIQKDWETGELLYELDILTSGFVEEIDDFETVHSISDLNDLSILLAQSESTKACLATQYYRYVGGYDISKDDRCAMNNLNKHFKDSGFNLQALFVAITQLDSFVLRK